MIVGQIFAQQKPTAKIFRDCKECPEMVVIPAGKFIIGSPQGEVGRDEVEGPQKEIHIKSFAAGKYDVSRGEWVTFVLATSRPVGAGCAFSGFTDTSKKSWEANPQASWQHVGFPQDDTHPVVCITWQDAKDYTEWLSKKTGRHYRLLTEAEWEYAARAGSMTAYPWGVSPSHEYANYGADSGWTGLVSGKDKWFGTSPVGSFPANAFGLYDMHGNVLQYLEDYFSPSHNQLLPDGSPYKTDTLLTMTGRYKFMNGTRSSAHRMVRGGDWGDPPSMIRSGFRNWAPGGGFTIENYKSGGVGFRIARDL